MNVGMLNRLRNSGEEEIENSEQAAKAGIMLGLAAKDQFPGLSERDAVDIGAAFFWQAMLGQNPQLESLRERFVRKTFLKHESVMTELANQLKR